MSTSFCSKSGSVERLNVSTFHGRNRRFFQTRATVFADVVTLGEGACSPARRLVVRERGQCVGHDRFDDSLVDQCLAASAGCDDSETVYAFRQEDVTPICDRYRVRSKSRAVDRIDAPSARARITLAWRTFRAGSFILGAM